MNGWGQRMQATVAKVILHFYSFNEFSAAQHVGQNLILGLSHLKNDPFLFASLFMCKTVKLPACTDTPDTPVIQFMNSVWHLAFYVKRGIAGRLSFGCYFHLRFAKNAQTRLIASLNQSLINIRNLLFSSEFPPYESNRSANCINFNLQGLRRKYAFHKSDVKRVEAITILSGSFCEHTNQSWVFCTGPAICETSGEHTDSDN